MRLKRFSTYYASFATYDGDGELTAPDSKPTVTAVKNGSDQSWVHTVTQNSPNDGEHRLSFPMNGASVGDVVEFRVKATVGGLTQTTWLEPVVIDKPVSELSDFDPGSDPISPHKWRTSALMDHYDTILKIDTEESNGGTLFVGDVISVDGELMLVTADNGSDSYTVQRGYRNTTAATISAHDAVYLVGRHIDADDQGRVKLASDGLDDISTDAPSGVASNFREMLVQTWRRFFKKTAYDKNTSKIKTYDDDGSTVLTTQDATKSGGVMTQGEAS